MWSCMECIRGSGLHMMRPVLYGLCGIRVVVVLTQTPLLPITQHGADQKHAKGRHLWAWQHSEVIAAQLRGGRIGHGEPVRPVPAIAQCPDNTSGGMVNYTHKSPVTCTISSVAASSPVGSPMLAFTETSSRFTVDMWLVCVDRILLCICGYTGAWLAWTVFVARHGIWTRLHM